MAGISVTKLRKLLADVSAYSTLRGIWIGTCPCHQGANVKLTLRLVRGDRVELKCSDACELSDILEARGWS